MTRCLVLFMMLLVLAACARQPVYQAEDSAAWEAHRNNVDAINDWKIEGRIGLYSDNEAWPGDLHWLQTGKSYDIRLIAPVAAGSLHIYSVPNGVMFEQSSYQHAQFTSDPEGLIKKNFGWQLPIADLRYWIKGIPSPESAVTGMMDVDEQGRLRGLTQSGWKITYQRYIEQAGKTMPKKVLIEQEDLAVKIVIRKWQFL